LDVERIARLLSRCVEAIVVAMFAAVFAAFIYKIVMRYAFGDAVAWADEVSIVLFVWIVFLANGFVLNERDQITFDLIHRNLPARGQRAIEIVRNLLACAILVYALPAAVDYTMFLWRERTPVLRWRLDIVYACFALFLIAVIVHMAWQLIAFAADHRLRRAGEAR
jgi:TRAP-type C4-dicarboxylate transport system permease small subunit